MPNPTMWALEAWGEPAKAAPRRTDGVPERSRMALTSPIGHPIYVTIAPRGSIENLRFPATHLDEQTHPAVITTDRHQPQDSSGLTIERCWLGWQVFVVVHSAVP